MHQPRPRGQSVVGGELTDDDSALIESVARRLTNLKTLSGVDSLRMVRALPDGGYVVAQNMGGVFKCITHKPEEKDKEKPFDGVATDYIPALFSGVITDAVLQPEEGLKMRLTNQTQRRLSGYGESDPIPERLKLQRFRIDYNTRAQEFKPRMATFVFYTQYAQQRPTWYSGAMAEVMQIVGGYGRQDFDSLPEDSIERARMVLPREWHNKVSLEMGNIRLPGYTGEPDRDGEFQYDYKFHETNAVGFDTGKRPWLLRVSRAGLYAMPLPVIPATATKAFREYMEDVGDDEILNILDRFGGMPSGETFPDKSKDFEAWRRAGVIIKVCDTGDFYDHIAYSSACGWSFNSTGTEACNTCYDYDYQEGLGYGLAYKMKIELSAADHDGKLPKSFDLYDYQDDSKNKPEDLKRAQKLDAYLMGIYDRISSNDASSLAIKYKLRRVPVDDLLSRANGSFTNMDSEVDYWDGLELDPIASHNGNVTQFSEGWLYHPAKFMYQPQIKYPEPFLGGCVSHDFSPLINGRNKGKYPNCNTIMFCYYVGDSLKVVKYFRDGRSYIREVESDYEACMTVGAWTKREYNSATALTEGFYTSDVDDREAVTANETLTNMVGKDLGYDAVPKFAFVAYFDMRGSMWRRRFFSRETKVTRSEGRSLSSAICVPYLSRNAIIYAHKERTTGGSVTETGERLSVTDPWSYGYWTYDFVWAWRGGDMGIGGKPYPKDGSPVWVGDQRYSPSQCSDFADQGPWVSGFPADYTWLIHPKSNEWKHSGGGGPPHYTNYSHTEQEPSKSEGRLEFSVDNSLSIVHKSIPANRYFLGSPDPMLGPFYRDACKVVIGESDYSNVSENVGGRRKSWGHTRLADHKSAHHFIGVINE